MPRFLAVFAFLTLILSSLSGQPQGDSNIPLEYFIPRPKNTFSASIRYGARAKVNFRQLGTISSGVDLAGQSGILDRRYNDGYVLRDARTDDNSNPLAPDGKTNAWSYNFASQVVNPDQPAIAFHQYSSSSNGASQSANSGPGLGWDMEFTHQFGASVPPGVVEPSRWTWGGGFGFNLDNINGKTSGTITADLNTVTDTYSLLGSSVPAFPYTSPSTANQIITRPDGTTQTITTTTSVLIPQQPDSRTGPISTPGGATIDGFWQAKGAYYTLRLGPWVRWQPNRRFSFRASAAITGSWVGAKFRYDETLRLTDVTAPITVATETKIGSYGSLGYYLSLQSELWITDRTGFFGGLDYQGYVRKIILQSGDRQAEIKLSSGLGIRFGITTRF